MYMCVYSYIAEGHSAMPSVFILCTGTSQVATIHAHGSVNLPPLAPVYTM
jgi:hypothetical protein